MPEVQIPNGWAPRVHQLPLWRALVPRDGVKRAVAVWHRRAGKDSTALNLTAVKAHQRVGTYWHLLPTQVQARRTVWNETDAQERRIIDQVWPLAVREHTRDSDMSIRLLNGSLWQLGGSDNFDSLVGSNVVGVVFSEWALCDPGAWDYIRPILVENGGWALFISTPRGYNHCFELYEVAKRSTRWYCGLATVSDTKREDGTPVISEAQLQQERDEGMSAEIEEQEYHCSFAGVQVGAIHGQAMRAADQEGRILRVPHRRQRRVDTFWDIGIRGMAVWMGQRAGMEMHWIDYFSSNSTNLTETVKHLRDTRRMYDWGEHWFPHDVEVQEHNGWTRRETVEDLGWAVNVVPKMPVEDGINAADLLIGQSLFDEEHCKGGIDALRSFRREWDEKRRSYGEKPVKDWASHGADAFRMAAVVLDLANPYDDFDVPVGQGGRRPRNITVRPRAAA